MQNILSLSNTNKLILATFASLAIFAIGTGKAHAATLNVSGGCTLPIAISSVNAGTNQSGCTASGIYGADDTINIPSGTITLTSDLTIMTESVNIRGAGMGRTTIDGAGQYFVFEYSGDGDLTISDLKITNFARNAVYSHSPNLTVNNVEVDGAGSVPTGGSLNALEARNVGADTILVDINNVYVHNFDSSVNELSALVLAQSGTGTIDADFQGVTISDIHNAGTGHVVQGINLFVNRDGGTINAIITNTTVHDVTGEDLVTPFASFGMVDSGPGNSAITTLVRNITITGTRGATGTGDFAGVKSAAFYAVSLARDNGDTATTKVDVTNSLMADNLNDGLPSNCIAFDISGFFVDGGTGSAEINSLGYNLSDDDSCTGFNELGDQQNVGNITSTLGPLQNNDGAVPTRELLAGSPAISAGGAVLGVTTDARGIARNGYYSVGAYQYVLGNETSSPSVGGNAAAPNTGAENVSTLFVVASFAAGIILLGYTFSRKLS